MCPPKKAAVSERFQGLELWPALPYTIKEGNLYDRLASFASLALWEQEYDFYIDLLEITGQSFYYSFNPSYTELCYFTEVLYTGNKRLRTSLNNYGNYFRGKISLRTANC
jgi:hypothetical protein